MTPWAARPLWVAGAVFLLVCLAAAWIPLEAVQWLHVICAAALMPVLAVPCIRRLHVPTVALLACVFASAAFITAETTRYLPASTHVGKTVYVQAQVRKEGNTVQLRVQGGDLPKGICLRLYGSSFDPPLTQYETLSAHMTLTSFEGQGLTRLQQKAANCLFAAKLADKNPVRCAGKVPWTDIFDRARHSAVSTIENTLKQGPAAVVSGICFGEDRKLTVTAASDFRTCGVSHLFAVSGLHMSVLATGLLLVLRKLRVPRVWQAVFTLTVLFAFMMIVGLSASVVRAGVLCALVLVGNCLRRQADARTSLGTALLILLVVNPYAAYDAGLLLSFASTYGLLVWSAPLQQLFLRVPHRPKGKLFAGVWELLTGGVAVTLAATFATVPVLVIYFGTLPLLSVPANLLTSFASTVILVVGCMATLMAAVLPFVSKLFLIVCGWLADYLLWVCRMLASFPFATLFVKATHWILWIAGAYVLVAIGWLLYRKRGMVLSASVAIFVLCVMLLGNHMQSRGRVKVQAVPDSEDLAVCVYFEGFTAAVVSPSDVDTLYQMCSELEQNSVVHVDMLVLLGGKPSAVCAVPDVLYDYVTAQTKVLYEGVSVPFAGVDLSQATVQFSKNGNIALQDGFLQMTIGKNQLLFATQSAAEIPVAFSKAPLLFSAGQVQVLGTGQKHLPAQAGSRARTAQSPSAFILYEGEVFVDSD